VIAYPLTVDDFGYLDSLDIQLTELRPTHWVVPVDYVDPIAAVRRLLNDDAVAATMVAATINIRQAAGESAAAFVKRIVRSWLDEMERVHP